MLGWHNGVRPTHYQPRCLDKMYVPSANRKKQAEHKTYYSCRLLQKNA